MCLSNMFHKFSGRMDTLTSNNNGRKMPNKGSLVCINLTSAVSIAFHFLMNHSLTQITSLDFTTQHTVDSKRVLRHRSNGQHVPSMFNSVHIKSMPDQNPYDLLSKLIHDS
jgi:hypothetical protein